MPTAIEFNNVSKVYRLGQVTSSTLTGDLKRWWTVKIQRKEDPFLAVSETNDLGKKGRSDLIWALKDLSFKVEKGDVVGIIGDNGAGKSTLLKILSRITAPTTGTIKTNGRIGSLLEVGTGFNADMTGRENVFLNGAILGMAKAEIARRFDEIVDFSGCERFIDTPVKRYSSGMRMRLGFAVAANLDPEILLVDEVLAVGDVEFRKKAIDKMMALSRGEGRTVIFVSHMLPTIKQLCNTGILLNKGTMEYIGKIDGAIGTYLHYDDIDDIETDIPLGINRKGSGALRLNDVRVLDRNGAWRNEFAVGEECVISVGFNVTDQLRNSKASSISLGINDRHGNRIAWMSTALFYEKLDFETGEVRFRIKKLMLTQGKYNIVAIAYVDRVEADFVREVQQIIVSYQDYLGTGRKPTDREAVIGHTFLDYEMATD